jgi:hypothetical protein
MGTGFLRFRIGMPAVFGGGGGGGARIFAAASSITRDGGTKVEKKTIPEFVRPTLLQKLMRSGVRLLVRVDGMSRRHL